MDLERGDTRIVWVNLEPNVCKTLWGITVLQKTYKNCAVHCVLAPCQQLFHTLFVGCDVVLVHIWGYFHQYIHNDSTNIDKRHVLFIFYSRLDKHVQDIDYSDIPLLLFINNA